MRSVASLLSVLFVAKTTTQTCSLHFVAGSEPTINILQNQAERRRKSAQGDSLELLSLSLVLDVRHSEKGGEKRLQISKFWGGGLGGHFQRPLSRQINFKAHG